MENIKIRFTGNLQSDLNNQFPEVSGVVYETKKWEGEYLKSYLPNYNGKDLYEGYVDVCLSADSYSYYYTRWLMTAETARAIHDNTLKVGDYIHLQTLLEYYPLRSTKYRPEIAKIFPELAKYLI